MANPDARGKFVWYELTTSDVDVALAFYKKVFGWTSEDMPGNEHNFKMIGIAAKAMFGDIMEKPPGMSENMPSYWTAYVSVPDVDAYAGKVKELGGTIMVGPKDVPNMGRFAIGTDPQGAIFAMWQSTTSEDPSERMAEVGEITWHELTTKDQKAAWDFYSTLFGWEKDIAMPMGEMGDYQIFKRAGVQRGAMFNMPNVPPNWGLYARVADLDKAFEAVKANGGKVINGPMDVPGGRIFNFTDPTGAYFSAHQIIAG